MVPFDPRTKIMIIFFTVLSTAFFPSLEWEGAFILMIMLFGILNGRIKSSVIWTAVYGGLYLFWIWYAPMATGLGHTMLLAWISLIFKLFPCLIISSITLKTTKTNEFLTAMNLSHIPRQIVIPLAILLRYLPTVMEDWASIKDAMILRGVNPTLYGLIKRPVTTVECLYVPLLITASKTADELSIAAMTRGIDHPGRRTSITKLKLRWFDYLALLIFAVITIVIVILGRME